MASDKNMDKTKISKLTSKLYADLPWYEIVIWSACWIFAVFYSMYKVYLASMKYWKYMPDERFEKGFMGSYRKDVSDHEWLGFTTNLRHSLPWYFVHFIGTQIYQRYYRRFLPIFQAGLPLLFIYFELGFRPLILLLAQPLVIFCMAEVFQITIFVWGSAVAIIGLNDYTYIAALKEWAFKGETFHTYYMTHVLMFWINSRCVSFCLDHIWKDVKEESRIWKFIQLIGFCFYLPIGIQGPLLNYKDYKAGLYGTVQTWTLKRLKNIALLVVRYVFWYCFTEVFLHFFYVSAFRYEERLVATFDMWTLAGLGFTMGQFFHIKFVFLYGISRPLLMADGIEPTNHPKCIARIHLYSDMWRYFDEGLHKFMHRYIYLPIMNLVGNTQNILMQLLGAIITFSFVYIWHGIRPHLLTWSGLHCTGILVEKVASYIWHWEPYQNFERSLLSPQGQRRLHAALSAILVLMSICSSMYFLFGEDIGPIFLWRGFTSWPLETPTTLFFLYCGCQTSIEVKNWELRKAIDALEKQHTL